MTESIILDPLTIATGRLQLDITSFVSATAGVDWGQAEIDAYLSDQTIGSSLIDARIPNRQISIPLVLRDVGSTTFGDIRQAIQAKVALFQSEGGWLGRQIDGLSLYADIEKAALHLGGSWLAAYRNADIDAVLTFEVKPDWYGDEQMLAAHPSPITEANGVIWTESQIAGNYPARVRIIVTNPESADQHGLLWGVRSRHYSSAQTAAVSYEAETLGTLDAAAVAVRVGASGSSVIRHPALPAGAWCPVMNTNIGGTTYMTHRGTYRLWARCYSATATPALRFLWDVGDMTNPSVNDPIMLPSAANFHLVDLGVIRIAAAPTGSHRWQGVLQVKAAVQNDPIEIDKIWLQPLDEGAGRLAAVQQDSMLGISAERWPGTATSDSAVGVVGWNSPEQAIVEDGTVSNTNQTSGQTYYLHLSNFGFAIPAGSVINGFRVFVKRACSSLVTDDEVRLVKAGNPLGTNHADQATPWPAWPSLAWQTYGSQTDTWGATWTAAEVNSSTFGCVISATLETAASQADVDSVSIQAFYTTSGGFTTTPDAVAFAGQTVEVRTDGCYRSDKTGAAYGPVSSVIGTLPRLPVSGLENRPVEMSVRVSRGNFAEEPDSGTDGITAQLYYRPCYLFVP